MSCPWAIQGRGTQPTLVEIMSEDLAKSLQKKEEALTAALEYESSPHDAPPLPPQMGVGAAASVSPDCENDLYLAQMLQYEYDVEHDVGLQRLESHKNGTGKISVSLDHMRRLPATAVREDWSEEESSEDEELESPVKFNREGFAIVGDRRVTKHDSEICGRLNSSRLMNSDGLPVATGDLDHVLSNKVYNALKAHSASEGRRAARLHERKENSTAVKAVDEKTRSLLFKMINAEWLDSVSGVISTGKESVVLHGLGGKRHGIKLPDDVAIKVFKTTLTDFKTRADYLIGDQRFVRDHMRKQNPRKVIKLWAEKELANLQKMRKHGVVCPSVCYLRKHILVMSLIGDKDGAAPLLQEATLSSSQLSSAYTQCVQAMSTMYQKCNLVHADLSEFNMIWHQERLYIIDVSQAVDRSHPRSCTYLLRDCTAVHNFFSKRGVLSSESARHLFVEVTTMKVDPDQGDLEFATTAQRQMHQKVLSAAARNINENSPLTDDIDSLESAALSMLAS